MSLDEVATFPFQAANTEFATYYREWSLSKSFSIIGAILRFVLIIVYTFIQGVLVLVNIILNLFGMKKDLFTFHSAVAHFMTGAAVPVSLKSDALRDEYMLLRNSVMPSWPLFWF